MTKCWRWRVTLKSEAGRRHYQLPFKELTVVFEDGFFFVAGVKVCGNCDPSRDDIADIIRTYLKEHYNVPKRLVVVKSRGPAVVRPILPLWRVMYSGDRRTRQSLGHRWHTKTLQIVRAGHEAGACRIVGDSIGVPPDYLVAARTFRK